MRLSVVIGAQSGAVDIRGHAVYRRRVSAFWATNHILKCLKVVGLGLLRWFASNPLNAQCWRKWTLDLYRV
jgi:hypothetical protein